MFGKSSWSFSNWGLRVKAALLVILPFLVFLFIFFITDKWNERKVFEDQITLSSIQLGDILLDSLQHGMLHNDREMLHTTLANVVDNNAVKKAWIINLSAQVMVSNNPAEEGLQEKPQSLGCQLCHQYPPDQRPRVMRDTTVGSELIRISTPIKNQPQCWGCHPSNQSHLGVLLIDASMADVDKKLQKDLQDNLLGAALVSLILGVGVYFTMNKMIVSRIETLHKILIRYGGGDFGIRVNADDRQNDEIASLGKTFNQMADKLEESKTQIEERARVREAAVIEERERIAGELHDGIAQFLGYVTTKAQAAIMFIEKGNSKKADEFLHHIEEETRKQSINVRAAILGLKIFTAQEHHLSNDIREGLSQSNRFMDLEIVPILDKRLENLTLDPEIELQLIRIVREAAINVRKHSQAHNASVSLELLEGNIIRLSISDDGKGFDVEDVSQKGQPHFGLATMRERAKSIGGTFEVKTGPQQGTTISVTMPLPEKKA